MKHQGLFGAIDRSELFTSGKKPAKVVARSLFCCFAVSELGTSQSELSRHLGLSAAAASMAVKRGRKVAGKEDTASRRTLSFASFCSALHRARTLQGGGG